MVKYALILYSSSLSLKSSSLWLRHISPSESIVAFLQPVQHLHSSVYCKFAQFTSASIWIASWLATAVYKFKKVIRCWFHCCNSSSISSSSKTHPWLAEIPGELIEYVESNVKMLICFSLFVKCKKLFVNVINIPRTAHVPQVVLLNLCY